MLWPNATPMMDPSILSSQEAAGAGDKARYMIAPIAVMVLSMPAALYITGDGNIAAGLRLDIGAMGRTAGADMLLAAGIVRSSQPSR